MAQIPTAARVSTKQRAPVALPTATVPVPAAAAAVAAPAPAATPAVTPAGSAGPNPKQLLLHWEESSALDAQTSSSVAQLTQLLGRRTADSDAARHQPARIMHAHAADEQERKDDGGSVQLSLLEQLAQRESASALSQFASSRAQVSDMSLLDTSVSYPFVGRAIAPAQSVGGAAGASVVSHASILTLLLSAQLYSTTPQSIQHLTAAEAAGPERALVEAGFPVSVPQAPSSGAGGGSAGRGGLSAHQRHLLYYLQLRSTAASLQSLLESSAALLSSSESLLSLFHTVFSKTNSVREECSALLAEQQALAADSLKFNYHLSYFLELDTLQSKLADETAQPVLARFMRDNADGHALGEAAHAGGGGHGGGGPRTRGANVSMLGAGLGPGGQGGSVALAQQQLISTNPMLAAEFPHILTTLDHCADYLRSNADFLDAPSARARYDKLHAAILRACRNYVKNCMELAIRMGMDDAASHGQAQAQAQAAQQQHQSDDPSRKSPESTVGVSLYHSNSSRMKVFVQLRALAHSLKPLMLEMEHRAFVNEGGIFGAGFQSPIAPAPAASDSSSSSSSSSSHGGAGGAVGAVDSFVSTQPAHYKELLMDCYRIYSEKRHALLYSELQAHLNALIASGRPLSSLVRSACVSWIEVCLLESQLFFEFFSSNSHSSGALNDLLASFCSGLYTALRPVVIQNPDMDALAEVITILQVEVVQEQVQARGNARGHARRPSASASSSSSSASSSSSSSGAPSALVDAFHPSSPLYAFSKSIQRLIADVQERLIYRAQLYIRDAIQHYNNTKEDLDYPARLTAASQAKSPTATGLAAVSGSSSSSSSLHVSRRDTHLSQWHPVLERTLLFLSKLYRCIEVSVFKYLAAEAVSVCTAALLDCSTRITASHAGQPDAPLSDGLLFLIKHLLILREQIAPFSGVDFAVTSSDLDFSHMRDVLPNIFSSVGKWSSFLELVHTSAPRLRESKMDSKKHMEQQLKSACEQLIAGQTQQLLGPLLEFFNKMGATHGSGEAQHQPAQFKQELVDIVTRMTGRPPGAGGADGSSGGGALGASLAPPASSSPFATHLSAILRHTSLYLSNPVTERVLFKPIHRTLMEVFEQLTFFVHTHFPKGQDAAVSSSSVAASTAPMSHEDALTVYLEESIVMLETIVRDNFRD